MPRLGLLAVLLISLVVSAQPKTYYPDADWQHRSPAEAGFDEQRLREALDFAIGAESRNPQDTKDRHHCSR